MLCSICQKKEATVFLTNIAGDKMQKVNLCEECAKAKGMDDPTGFSFADKLLGLGATQEMKGWRQRAAVPGLRFTNRFRKAGRLAARNVMRTLRER